jgi:hypothetical protein
MLIFTLAVVTVRSISILGMPAEYSLLLQVLADLVVLDDQIADFFWRAYQRLSQSLMTPTRSPWGLTFCPIVYLLPYSFSFRPTVM